MRATVEEAREMLLDAAPEMIASYQDEGRKPPIGGGHVEPITIELTARSGGTWRLISAAAAEW